ncbi:MAG TPA: DegT/DnrJ/EryC1/StrS family aminotransferase [Proteobacteria bacterium]|nr:DegT/DnrJ/EryC1/StrS family aminotransferase [Pseudomonadota bacterium]
MSVPFVDLSRQFAPLLPQIRKSFDDIISRSAFINGPEVGIFEKELAVWMGLDQACGVSSGTHALSLTLQALGIGPGDEVITVANTAFPTAEAISLTGAEVVFVDISPGTFAMDPEAAAAAITPKTRALLPVHLYGIPADMDALRKIAERHRLYLIEDVAQAMGARYQGRRVGSIGQAGCFSFFPSKNLGTFGDGGAMAANDQKLVTRVRMLANHGRQDKFTHEIIGTNSRLDTLKAAQLSICLKALDDWNADRRRAAALYDVLLTPYPEIIRPQVPVGGEAIWHLYVIRHPKREALRRYLQGKGIQTGLHYPQPLHRQPAYAYLDLKAGSLPRTEAATAEVLSLPMFPYISAAEIETVVRAIADFLGGCR